MSNRTRLRELGYSADADGIVCHREGAFDERYLHERCGVVRLDLERDSKPARELVEKLIVAVDEPRALTGRDRRGGAVLLFRVGEHSEMPQWDYGIRKLITREGELLTVTCASLNQLIDVGAWSWIKGRPPLDASRDSLAVMFADVGERCADAALKLGCEYAPTEAEVRSNREREERLKKYRAEIAAGMHTPEAVDARADAEDKRFLAAHSDLGPFDSMFAMVQSARQRIFQRSQARKERAAAAES